MSKNNRILARDAVLALFALILSACGGGGGGGSTAPPPVSLVVTPTTLSASAIVTDAAPTAKVSAYFDSDPNSTTPYYISGSFSGNGIASVSNGDGSGGNVAIQFKTPSSLGAGIYSDTVTIKGCYDSACTRQVQHSPQTVAVTYIVTGPAAALTSISPIAVTKGGGPFVLTLLGSGFTSVSVARWNSAARPTTFVSSSQLTISISASDIATADLADIDVASGPSAGDPISNSLPLFIEGPPSLASLSPSTMLAGSAAFTMNVSGTNFTPASIVLWNGSPRVTMFVSPTQMTAAIAASDVATTGTFQVTTATDASSAAIVSSALPFTVQAPPPLTLSRISPSTITAAGPGFVLVALGQSFAPTAVIQWNGSARPTTFVSGTELQAQIPASDIAAVATASITVQNSTAAGGTSTSLPLTVKAAAPDAVAFQINASHSGAMTFKSLSFPATSAWSVDVGGVPSYALIADGKVIVTATVGSGAQLIALDQATGATVWGPIALSVAANAAYDNGQVFVVNGTIAGAAIMQAYNGTTGALAWSTVLRAPTVATSGPTAYNGTVYVGGDGLLYAMSEGSGSIVWTEPVQNGDASIPAVTDSGVYVTYPCWTYAFQPATGSNLFNNNTGCEGGGGATPVVANSVLYSPNMAGSPSGTTFDALSGLVLGTYVSDTPPAIGTQMGYFLQSATLRGLTLNNNAAVWSFAGDGALVTAPILVNQDVIVGSSTGNVYALDAATGNQVWMVNAGGSIPAGTSWGTSRSQSGLAAGDGLLVIPAGTKVVAYVLSNNP